MTVATLSLRVVDPADEFARASDLLSKNAYVSPYISLDEEELRIALDSDTPHSYIEEQRSLPFTLQCDLEERFGPPRGLGFFNAVELHKKIMQSDKPVSAADVQQALESRGQAFYTALHQMMKSQQLPAKYAGKVPASVLRSIKEEFRPIYR